MLSKIRYFLPKTCLIYIFHTDIFILQAISTINTLLEKADRIYKQLQLHRPALENLMVQVAEHGTERREDGVGPPGAIQGPAVNKAIQQLAVKYCTESKSSFDELSKIIQVRIIKLSRGSVDG